MKILNHDKTSVVLKLTEQELLVISNALNEICYGVKIVGFQSRIGRDKEFVKTVHNYILEALDKTEDSWQKTNDSN